MIMLDIFLSSLTKVDFCARFPKTVFRPYKACLIRFGEKGTNVLKQGLLFACFPAYIEVLKCAIYCVSAQTEEGKKELLFLSNKNPFQLLQICSSK